MMSEFNLLPLKLLVIFLGLTLVGAIVFVLCAITNRARSDMHAEQCADATLHLGDNSTLEAITPQGRNIVITLSSDNGSKVMTVDRCTGTVLQTLTVMP